MYRLLVMLVAASCHGGFGGQSVGNCRELWVEGGAAGRIN